MLLYEVLVKQGYFFSSSSGRKDQNLSSAPIIDTFLPSIILWMQIDHFLIDRWCKNQSLIVIQLERHRCSTI